MKRAEADAGRGTKETPRTAERSELIEATVGAHGLYFNAQATGGGATCGYGYEIKL